MKEKVLQYQYTFWSNSDKVIHRQYNYLHQFDTHDYIERKYIQATDCFRQNKNTANSLKSVF